MSFGVDRESMKKHIDNIIKWSKDQNYSTHIFVFGSILKESGFFDFSDTYTNYSTLVNHINDRSKDLNIVLTDGNSTQGYSLSDIDSSLPINIIGLGRMQKENISIKNVDMELFVNRGDTLEISIEIESILDIDLDKILTVWSEEALLNSKKVKLKKGENIYREKIFIPTKELEKELILDIILSDNMSNAKINLNDSYKSRILILDSSANILLLTGSLSPNTQIIKSILSNIPNSSVNHYYKTSSSWSAFNYNRDFKNMDLIVYDNFPIDKSDYELFDRIGKSKNDKSKIIYFEGPSYDFNTINKINLSNKEILSKKDLDRNNFLSNKAKIKKIPPINRNFSIRSREFDKIYLEYSDSTISIGEENQSLYFFIPELPSLSINENLIFFNKYIEDIIYLFMDSGKNILLNSEKREVLEGEKVILDFSYFQAYDTLKSSIVIRNIDSEKENEIRISKLKVDTYKNRYLDNLDMGSYELYLKMNSKLDNYESNRINLLIKENNSESENVYRNEKEMRSITSKTHGYYYNIESIDNIKSLITSYKNIKKKKIEINIHSFHKFWFILLITLIIEWFFRKQRGLL